MSGTMVGVRALSELGWRLLGVVGAFAIGMVFFVLGLLAGVVANRFG